MDSFLASSEDTGGNGRGKGKGKGKAPEVDTEGMTDYQAWMARRGAASRAETAAANPPYVASDEERGVLDLLLAQHREPGGEVWLPRDDGGACAKLGIEVLGPLAPAESAFSRMFNRCRMPRDLWMVRGMRSEHDPRGMAIVGRNFAPRDLPQPGAERAHVYVGTADPMWARARMLTHL